MEPKPCPTCGYQIDRVERLNNDNARLVTALRRIKSLEEKNVSKYAQQIAAEALEE